jgi:hypothetical protein
LDAGQNDARQQAIAVIDFLPGYLLEDPKRMVTCARWFVCTGGSILIAGAIGKVATAGIAAILSIAHTVAPMPSLASLYPSIPTWWVPESVLGCIPAALLIVGGIALASIGRKIQRAYF